VKQLILGGARSGKSRLAEQLAAASCSAVTYIATAQCLDAEMEARVARHRARRPAEWLLIEAPLQLSAAIKGNSAPDRVILVDCLTLWLSNLLHHEQGRCFDLEMAALLQTLAEVQNDIILVSNEVGMGIVPLGELSRRFQDESGWMHQALAPLCDRVILTVAGLPHVLKGDAV